MAKRIIMIPPFEVLTGNLSGKQNLQYAENNNPAYEAPNGTQSARNYTTRYVGAKRSDGKTYFAVRRKNTAVLNVTTRMQMALVGAIAAIKSALKSDGTLATIKQSYDYILAHGLSLPEGVTTFNKYVDYYLRDMLRYRKTQWTFNQASITFTVHNPFDLDSSSALVIKQATWVKFADILAKIDTQTDMMYVFFIGGKKLVAAGSKTVGVSFGAFVPSIANIANPMYKAAVTGLSLGNDDAVLYQGYPIALGGVPVVEDDKITDGAHYAVI